MLTMTISYKDTSYEQHTIVMAVTLMSIKKWLSLQQPACKQSGVQEQETVYGVLHDSILYMGMANMIIIIVILTTCSLELNAMN